jgi:alkylation response protein AidB-like acyl-CoA dehydrogenase
MVGDGQWIAIGSIAEFELALEVRTPQIIGRRAARSIRSKYWTTDLQCRLIDECLQLLGGYGYMRDYPIGRAFVDARAQRIYGGTNEIMKEIISRGN